MTNAGGPALACADACAAAGLEPAEPVDLRARATAADYAAAIAAAEGDAVIAIFVPLADTRPGGGGGGAPRVAGRPAGGARPLLAVFMAQDETTLRELGGGLPRLRRAGGGGAHARQGGRLRALARGAAAQPEPVEADGDAAAAVLAQALARRRRVARPATVEALLGAYGFRWSSRGWRARPQGGGRARARAGRRRRGQGRSCPASRTNRTSAR